MDARLVGFGDLEVEGKRYDVDVVIKRGQVRRRRKKPSKAYRDRFGHTRLSAEESIPWGGPRLIVGTGADGQLISAFTAATMECGASRGSKCPAFGTT
jgi:hypothetical protein